MTIRITTADAFTAAPFAGNPAAVCLLPAPRDDSWMQAVAREMNLAETAFLLRCGDEFGLRWLTPVVEVDLCGHATLGSAHVLWEEGHLDRAAEARVHTRSGLLTARREGDWISLDFPATPPAPCEPPAGLERALGAPSRLVLKTPFDYLVELESEAAVKSLAPDLGALARLGGRGV
ncbi:MAG TPA: PhzF family phenazine biosynthesis protein, partial [Gemmatimonadales bacterium]|nr:PhzF family phenazine biosynthesis protein [Gemmatimonadales bacterium]